MSGLLRSVAGCRVPSPDQSPASTPHVKATSGFAPLNLDPLRSDLQSGAYEGTRLMWANATSYATSNTAKPAKPRRRAGTLAGASALVMA
jgi:hypothetical protein